MQSCIHQRNSRGSEEKNRDNSQCPQATFGDTRFRNLGNTVDPLEPTNSTQAGFFSLMISPPLSFAILVNSPSTAEPERQSGLIVSAVAPVVFFATTACQSGASRICSTKGDCQNIGVMPTPARSQTLKPEMAKQAPKQAPPGSLRACRKHRRQGSSRINCITKNIVLALSVNDDTFWWGALHSSDNER